MTREQIEKEFVDLLINKLGVDASEISPEADLSFDLGADSIDMVEMYLETEKHFNIKINSEDEEILIKVEDFINYIDEYKKNN